MDDYRKPGKSDLSGMNPDQLFSHLQPHYSSDEDFTLENIIYGLVPPLAAIIFLACVAYLFWFLWNIF